MFLVKRQRKMQHIHFVKYSMLQSIRFGYSLCLIWISRCLLSQPVRINHLNNLDIDVTSLWDLLVVKCFLEQNPEWDLTPPLNLFLSLCTLVSIRRMEIRYVDGESVDMYIPADPHHTSLMWLWRCSWQARLSNPWLTDMAVFIYCCLPSGFVYFHYYTWLWLLP